MALILLGCTSFPLSAYAADEDEQLMVTADVDVEVDVDQTLTLTVSRNLLRFAMSANTPTSQSLIVSAGTNNYTGYTISLSTSRDYNELKHSNTAVRATIPSIVADTALDNFTGAAWGYSADQATTKTYHQIPVDLEDIFVTDAPSQDEYEFAIGVRTSEETASGSYSNMLVFTALANLEPEPIVLPFDGITTMQAMTSDICNEARIGDTSRLRDVRDNKYYWVTKLKDNHCWMTQNLDFDLDRTVALTPESSDVSESWTPPYTTRTSGWDWQHQTAAQSFDYGYYYVEGGRGTTISSAAGLDNEAEEWHWSVGNYYNWYAVSAGTADNYSSGQNATSSICPKGWHLPSSNGDGSYTGMINAEGLNNEDLQLTPIYLTLNGSFYGSPSNLGQNGTYWTGTAANNGQANFIQMGPTYTNSGSTSMSNGGAVRCLAR